MAYCRTKWRRSARLVELVISLIDLSLRQNGGCSLEGVRAPDTDEKYYAINKDSNEISKI